MVFPSVSSKLNHYSQNGSGRDTYISQNNGGLYTKKSSRIGLQKSYEVGSLSTRTFRNFQGVPSSNKIISYVPDGQGRDSYIISGSPQFKSNNLKSLNFISHLRDYQQIRKVRKSDIFSAIQHQPSLKDTYKSNLLKVQQLNLSQMLSQPKIKRQKQILQPVNLQSSRLQYKIPVYYEEQKVRSCQHIDSSRSLPTSPNRFKSLNTLK